MYTHEKCTFLVDHHQAENIWHIIAGLGTSLCGWICMCSSVELGNFKLMGRGPSLFWAWDTFNLGFTNDV